jgi:hypothetical protein
MRFIILAALAVAGCASNSGVVPVGGDQFMVARQAATGLGGQGNLKGEALTEANAYCARQGKTMELVKTWQNEGPYLLGKYPRTEVTFRCVTPA